MMHTPRTITKIQEENGELTDIVIHSAGKSLHMLGCAGQKREEAFIQARLDQSPKKFLPVLIGTGLGHGLSLLLAALEKKMGPNCPVLIIDKEQDILEVTEIQKAFSHSSAIQWISPTTHSEALIKLTKWQQKHGNLPLYSFTNPFYSRLDKEFYDTVRTACEASHKANIWQKMAYPRFAVDKPRILLLTSKYFLMGEFIAACERLDIPHQLVQVPDGEMGSGAFVEQLLSAIVTFKPDFALTINHLGVDREGVLVELFEKIQIPLASWFVDNPHLILALYTKLVSPWTALYTWDADNLPSLRALGFSHVEYLPLGTDPLRFHPPTQTTTMSQQWKADISFVGNSMVHKVTARQKQYTFPTPLVAELEQVAEDFSCSEEHSIEHFFQQQRPDLLSAYTSLEGPEERLGYEAMLTWEATRQYRLSCVAATFTFSPLIVGDNGWKKIVPSGVTWRYHPELNYYSDLPRFYPCSAINFNCTSKQMKGAVNQRVFDVPATQAFLLTDYRKQIENLFEPGKEVICYTSPDEAKELAERYLASPKDRDTIARAARKRILAEHTYEHRVLALAASMRKIYG